MTALYVDHLARKSFEDLTGQNVAVPANDPALGLRRDVREKLHSEIMGVLLHEDHILNEPERAPDDVQAAFKDLIGKEPDFLLRLHPYYKRWTVFERTRREGHWGYCVVSIFWQEVEGGLEDDYLADDYKGDRGKAHLRGLVGEFRVPSARDFKIIRDSADHRLLDPTAMEAKLNEPDLKEERDAACDAEAQKHDFLSYSWNAARDDANQRAGSGQRLDSFDTIENKSNPERWNIEQHVGFRVRTKVGGAAELRRATLRAEAETRLRNRVDNLIAAGERENRRRSALAATRSSKSPGGRVL